MKKIIIIIAVTACVFTGCSKEEETPEPVPVVTTPAPVVTTQSYSYTRGSGLSDLNLKVTDASSNVIFFNNVNATAGSVTFPINNDEVYTYIVTANGTSISETGTYGYNSSTGFWFTPPASNQIDFHLQGINLTIWKP